MRHIFIHKSRKRGIDVKRKEDRGTVNNMLHTHKHTHTHTHTS